MSQPSKHYHFVSSIGSYKQVLLQMLEFVFGTGAAYGTSQYVTHLSSY